MSFSISDTIGFCEQYFEKYNNYKDLFVIIEWSMPQAHGKWNPVYAKSSAYNDQMVLPVVVPRANTQGVHDTMYVCKPQQVDYLSNKPIYDHVSWKQIDAHSRQHHEQQRQHYYENIYSLSRRLVEARQEIMMMQSWLQNRRISYLMFWALGFPPGPTIRPLVARTMSNMLEKDASFIPINDFTSMSYGAKHSIKPHMNHPDTHGQHAITEYLWQYILKNQLLKPS
jgi:hypothetical protein